MAATTIGATLRAERLRRNQQLIAIEAETKISRQILEALEDDQFDQIPGGAYRRSFLRQYARALGLDEDEVVAAFQQQFEEPPLPLPVPPKTKPIRFVAGLLYIALGAGGFASLYNLAKSAHPEGTYYAVAPVQFPRQAAPARPKPDTTIHSADRFATTATVPPPNDDMPAIRVGSVDSATAAVRVRFNVLEPVWVSVKCDGNQSYIGMLAAAESRVFEATHTVTVLIGNAAGVAIFVNGSPVGPIGAHGETQLLEITQSGARRLPHHSGLPKTYPPET